jgi:hypothetical protein
MNSPQAQETSKAPRVKIFRVPGSDIAPFRGGGGEVSTVHAVAASRRIRPLAQRFHRRDRAELRLQNQRIRPCNVMASGRPGLLLRGIDGARHGISAACDGDARENRKQPDRAWPGSRWRGHRR